MGRVIGALLYLRATSLKNALRSRLLRLRQPKYMVGAMVGAVYLYLVFFRRMRAGGASSAAVSLGMPADVLPLAVTLAALGLTIGAVLCWIWPRKRASLSFSEAEIGFLFPAPVSRRALIHYRLIGMQPGTLLSALIFGLISSRWSFIPGGAAIRIAGWWIVLATFALHIIGSSFVLTQLLDRGATSTRRRLSVFAMLGVAALLLTVWLRFGLVSAAGPDLSGFGPFIAHLNSLMSSGPLYWVSWPSRLVVKPMFAHDAVSFTLSLGPALFVYALHYYWVLHMNVSFEEASVEAAAKRAERVAAIRAGRGLRLTRSARKARRDPFALAAAGRAEVAFLWKSLLADAEYLRPRTALIAAAVITLGCLGLGSQPNFDAATSTIGMLSAVAAVYVLLFGPMFARQDFRRDLVNVDLLKVYPLPAWQIVAGELLTPVVVLTVLIWLLLLTAALTLPSPLRLYWFTPPLRAAIALGLGAAVPILCAIEVLVINAATLLFPAWLASTQQRSATGIEGFGLRIAFMFGLVLAIGVALLPAGIAALVVFAVSRWLIGLPVAVVLAAVVLLAVLAMEVGAGIGWLGRRFEGFDLSAELRS